MLKLITKNMKLNLTSVLLTILVSFFAYSCTSPHEPAPPVGSVAILVPSEDITRWDAEYGQMAYVLTANNYRVLAAKNDNVTAQIDNIKRLKGENLVALVYTSLDVNSPQLAQALGELRDQGVKIICYDRLQQSTQNVDLFVGSDCLSIGESQAMALSALPEGSRVEIISGSVTDQNASEYFDGAWSTIRYTVESGKWIVPSSRTSFLNTTIGKWSKEDAANYFNKLLDAHYADGKLPDGIIAPNDMVAQAVIDVLVQRGFSGTLPIITGQDNTAVSRAYIANGKQTMTIDRYADRFVIETLTAIEIYRTGGTYSASESKNNQAADIPMAKIPFKTVYKNDLSNN